jgi:predicted ATP-grasp superfamily ATP-dependent carboligase
MTILAEAEQDYLDPGAASAALKVLAAMLNVQINTAELDKENATLIKSSREKIIKSKISKKGPEGGMYG